MKRASPFYGADLLTLRLADTEPLADVLARKALTATHWTVLGKLLHRFHAAGVRHDDINARNVLMDRRGGFYVIDFDKARLLPRGAWQAQNLARFRRSLEKFKAADAGFHFGEDDWQALRSGYKD